MNTDIVLIANLGEACGGSVGVSCTAAEDKEVVNVHSEDWERAAYAGSDVSFPEVLCRCSSKGLISPKDHALLAEVGCPRPPHAHGVDAEPNPRVWINADPILSNVAPCSNDVKVPRANAVQGEP